MIVYSVNWQALFKAPKYILAIRGYVIGHVCQINTNTTKLRHSYCHGTAVFMFWKKEAWEQEFQTMVMWPNSTTQLLAHTRTCTGIYLLISRPRDLAQAILDLSLLEKKLSRFIHYKGEPSASMAASSPLIDGKKITDFKVTDLRQELDKRGLETKGLKADLVKRLEKVTISLAVFEDYLGDCFGICLLV